MEADNLAVDHIALNAAAEQARQAGVNVTFHSKTVILNYEHATRQAARKLGEELTRLGFECTWSSSTIDGDDEEWTLASQGKK